MNRVLVEIKVLPHGEKFYLNQADGSINFLPEPSTPGSAAVDLICTHDILLYPGQTAKVQTGLAINIMQEGVCAMVLPRSGLGAKEGLILGNSVGLIDNDYQGELLCFMTNRNETETGKCLIYKAGTRFAQMMFVPFLQPAWIAVAEFSMKTERGEGGFGSTG